MVSDKAAACPKCGFPLNKENTVNTESTVKEKKEKPLLLKLMSSVWTWVIVVILAFLAYEVIDYQKNHSTIEKSRNQARENYENFKKQQEEQEKTDRDYINSIRRH